LAQKGVEQRTCCHGAPAPSPDGVERAPPLCKSALAEPPDRRATSPRPWGRVMAPAAPPGAPPYVRRQRPPWPPAHKNTTHGDRMSGTHRAAVEVAPRGLRPSRRSPNTLRAGNTRQRRRRRRGGDTTHTRCTHDARTGTTHAQARDVDAHTGPCSASAQSRSANAGEQTTHTERGREQDIVHTCPTRRWTSSGISPISPCFFHKASR